MKILVTGGTGFLGSWLTRALLEEGHEVRLLARKTSDFSALEGLKYQTVEGDVTQAESLLPACQGVQAVFHLAGLIAYRRSQRDLMEKINVQGTAHLLAAAEKAQVQRFVHLSSVTAVGAGFTPNEILNEKSSYNLAHLDLGYFETKRKAEALVVEATRQGKLDSVILNPSTIYGAGDARKGSRRNQIKAARGELRFYAAGGVSIISVQEAVQGILAAWRKGRSGERYILSGDNILIRDLLGMISELGGHPPPRFEIPRAAFLALGHLGDFCEKFGLRFLPSVENAWSTTLYHWFDHSKAKQELNFHPGPARRALADSVNWMREQGLLTK